MDEKHLTRQKQFGPKFSSDSVFFYRHEENVKLGLIILSVAGISILVFLLYLTGVLETKIPGLSQINALVSHIQTSIESKSLLGAFYSSFLGGIFFLFIPVELLFLRFLEGHLVLWQLCLVYMSGLFSAFTLNYFLGRQLSDVVIRLLTPKKFYKMKGKINQYGILTIFCTNLFPLPSPALSAVLGIIRYNKRKFYLTAILAQTLQYSGWVLLYKFVLSSA